MKDKKELLVDGYIASYDEKIRQRLQAIRAVIRETTPEAVEQISYGLIGYKLRGKPLVYFGGFANHIGFYATPNGHEAFKKEFALYKQGKGSVQFPHEQPLPLELVKRVVEYRVKEIAG
ncbi:DUF1801 domain-containing protein [Candidatus Saccharibacteria bacterium]|nr:MAG: DUF1801 domain-containing protein [Candidatus Saccharibacteria bacterium]